jgi:septum formation protein
VPQLILASGSPRRRDLLTEAGYAFETMPSDAEEIHDATLSPPVLTETNAVIKATPIAELHPDAVVLGSDTLVFLDSEPLGKPDDMRAAEAMLARLVGKTHQVCTGVALIQNGSPHAFHAITDVTFKALTEAEINTYLSLINPLDKAGAYAAQEHGEKIIAETRGSFTNVIGLPMDEVKATLAERFDIRPQLPDTSQ